MNIDAVNRKRQGFFAHRRRKCFLAERRYRAGRHSARFLFLQSVPFAAGRTFTEPFGTYCSAFGAHILRFQLHTGSLHIVYSGMISRLKSFSTKVIVDIKTVNAIFFWYSRLASNFASSGLDKKPHSIRTAGICKEFNTRIR